MNYVFFDENASDIPARYRLLNREQSARFSENTLAQFSTTASLKTKQIRGIETYYHILNILGKRLATEPKLSARIIGCNSDLAAERGNMRLSQDRAESVRKYFTTTWGIDEKRLKVQARNKPERASNSTDPDGAAENRRVEVVLEPQEALSPISSDEVICTAQPDVVRLFAAAASQEELREWALDMIAAPADKIGTLAKQRIITTLSGTGAPPATTDYRLSSADLRAIGDVAPLTQVQFRLRVLNSAGQFATMQTSPILVALKSLRAIVSNQADSTQSVALQTQSEQISRYALTFFDFDKAALNLQNEQILNIVKSRINAETEAAIVGYTDRVGEAAYNKRLSADRAKTVADMLSGVNAAHKAVSGLGETILLYDNDLPEGRFYCRMVEISLRNRVSAEGKRSAP